MEKLQNLYVDAFGGEKIGLIDLSQQSFYISAASIIFNPIFWNVIARQEYNTRFLTHLFHSPYTGCYALAVTIFCLGIFRDSLYNTALGSQPFHPTLHQPVIGAILVAVGNVLVLSSMWALGLTGTYLGDYFGILMEEPVTGFPFNVTGAPMYWGSTMSFLGVALWKGKFAGIVLTALVLVMYAVALRFEDPFTANIYAEKDNRRVTRSMTKSPVKTKKKA